MSIRQFITTATLSTLIAASAMAHCEIPCGVYTDDMRVEMIEEHCKTIEKSMAQIDALAADPGKNANQLTRWVMNKEKHADEIQEIVSQYFMTQRIKPGQEHYEEKLVLLHAMLIDAMKCKQTTDAGHVAGLREHLAAFAGLYFGKDEAK